MFNSLQPKNIWIINHPYHLNDIQLISEKYPGINHYIYVPHRQINFQESDNVLVIEKYKGLLNLIASLPNIRSKLKSMDIFHNDQIFIFNGQEFNNNVILSYIYKNYSKNVIVVDDGSSGYQFYLDKVDFSKRLKDKIRIFLFSRFLGIKFTIIKIGILHYFSIHFSFFKRILFPYKVNYDGDMEVICLKRTFKAEELDSKSCVFLSQPFYLADPGYLSYEEYVALLNRLIERIQNKYEVIYFKLHPNDRSDLLKDIFSGNGNIQFVSNTLTFEEFMLNNQSDTLYSFNSNALLYSFGSERKTVWLYKMISDRCTKDFMYFDNIVLCNGGVVVQDLCEL